MNIVISQRRGGRECEGLFCCLCFYDEFVGDVSFIAVEVAVRLCYMIMYFSFVWGFLFLFVLYHVTSRRSPSAYLHGSGFRPFTFHIRLHLCLSGHSLKLCSIGLPRLHYRRLHSAIFCSLGNERDSHRESVPSPPPR